MVGVLVKPSHLTRVPHVHQTCRAPNWSNMTPSDAQSCPTPDSSRTLLAPGSRISRSGVYAMGFAFEFIKMSWINLCVTLVVQIQWQQKSIMPRLAAVIVTPEIAFKLSVGWVATTPLTHS